MQKHVKTVRTRAGRYVYIYQLVLAEQTCYVLARTPARVAIRNTSIYTPYTSLAQAELVAEKLY